MSELDVNTPSWASVFDAIALASDQDQITWLARDGKRIAAIVPVDVAESSLPEAMAEARRVRQAASDALESAARLLFNTARGIRGDPT